MVTCPIKSASWMERRPTEAKKEVRWRVCLPFDEYSFVPLTNCARALLLSRLGCIELSDSKTYGNLSNRKCQLDGAAAKKARKEVRWRVCLPFDELSFAPLTNFARALLLSRLGCIELSDSKTYGNLSNRKCELDGAAAKKSKKGGEMMSMFAI